MKLIIAGSRHLKFDLSAIQDFIDALIPMDLGMPSEIVSGACKGVDVSGQNWAVFHGIPVTKFKPDWNKHGKAAGPIRNIRMAEYADALLLIWDGKSRGSLSMKSEAKKAGLKIYEVILRELD